MTTTIPDAIAFQDAIALTQQLLQADLEGETVSQLVSSVNGARGFFVVYLTAKNSPADQPSDEILKAFAQNPDTVNDLMVKNIVMSAAMTVTHGRNGDDAMVAKSQTTSDRALTHVKGLLELGGTAAENLANLVRQMNQALTEGTGDYMKFLTTWGYDPEQQQVMATAIAPLMENLG